MKQNYEFQQAYMYSLMLYRNTIFQFDNKRREVESWLGRMEVWLGQMRPVGSTADVLEAQVREQKVRRC